MTYFLELLATLVILFLSVILHEIAHGWTAYKLGDSTAKNAGRLTLNPLKHIDLVGTIILPGVLLIARHFNPHVFVFGWAKPVPVNFSKLRYPRRDMVLVAMAGPLTNILLAVIFSKILLYLGPKLSLANFEVIVSAIFINLLLATFNMIPVPPLDGSRLVMGFLPSPALRIYSKLEPYGIFIVGFLFVYLGLFDSVVIPIVEILGNYLGVSFK